MIRPREDDLAAIDQLIAHERRIERLLERASRAPEDPRAVAYLWNQATECRDHARILLRHRRKKSRVTPEFPYPRWKRNHGPTPDEALAEVRELATSLAERYAHGGRTESDPYLRKFMQILSEEHAARSHEYAGIASGEEIFDELGVPAVEA